MATLFFGGYDVPFLDESTLSPNIAALIGIAALLAKTFFSINFDNKVVSNRFIFLAPGNRNNNKILIVIQFISLQEK